MSVGENIKRFRKKAKMTQQELADSVGVKAPTITKYEKGNLEPSVDMLNKISEALSVSVSDLMPNGLDDYKEKLQIAISKVASKINSESNIEKNFIDKYVEHLLLTEGNDYFLKLCKEAKKRRLSLQIGLNKVSQFLDVSANSLESLEENGNINPSLLVEYALLLDDLQENIDFLYESLVSIPLLSDYSDFNLKELFTLEKDQLDYFIASTSNYMKFALEEAKKIETRKTSSVNPLKGLKSK